MTRIEKTTLWVWAIAWTLWLALQHVPAVLNFSGLSLSQANGLCSFAQQYPIDGVPAACPTVSTWWTFSTLLFWVGVIAAAVGIGAFLVSALRNTDGLG